MNIRLIRAFIASPGGLESERQAAFAAAEEINKSVALPLGGRLELIGWEETLSGAGRPQTIINADMETCELFIGAMWTRWGSAPAIDGPYSSGFEEEFERSHERHRLTERPIMAMFFKEIDPAQRADPGDELKKVLNFQKRLQEERSFLYGTFGDVEGFASRVRAFLSTHVIRLLQSSESPPDERPVASEQNRELPRSVVDQKIRERAPDVDFLIETAGMLRTERGATPVHVARLRLISTVAGQSDNDQPVIGVHDANLLYHGRSEFDLAFTEKRGLLQAGLSAINNENVPVWSWIAEINGERSDFLMGLTAFGEETERAGALTAVRMLQTPITPLPFLEDRSIETFWLMEDTPAPAKVAALQYLRDLGTREQLEMVKREADLAAKETVSGAIEAALAILLRENSLEAIRYLMSTSFEKLDFVLLKEALQHLDELSTQELKAGLDHRSAEIRSAVLTTLSERSVVDLGTLERARNDDASVVRLAGLRASDRLGQHHSLDEAYKIMARPRPSSGFFASVAIEDTSGVALFENYRAERMRNMAQQTLETLLEAPAQRDAAYMALAARNLGDFGDRLRYDLRDGFQAYFDKHWPDGIRINQNALASILSIGTADPAEKKRRELMRSALDIISTHGDPADLMLVRDVLDNRGVSPGIAVINYLKSTGTNQDIERLSLASRVSSNWFETGDTQRDFTAAASAILKLGHHDGLGNLLSRAMPEAMRARLIDVSTAAEFAKLSDDAIVKLLSSNDSQVRRATAMKVPMSVTRGRIARLLASYRASDGRFYVVTHWLDLGLAYSRAVSRKVGAAKG